MMSNNYPLEKQVCTQRQAQELAELLRDDAPESLWCWVWGKWGDSNPKWELTLGRPGNPNTKFYHAYTGDELGALLGRATNTTELFPVDYNAQDKADILIKRLQVGYIKKEEVRYG